MWASLQQVLVVGGKPARGTQVILGQSTAAYHPSLPEASLLALQSLSLTSQTWCLFLTLQFVLVWHLLELPALRTT